MGYLFHLKLTTVTIIVIITLNTAIVVLQLYRNIMRGRKVGRWLKDQKERKKQELRTHNARLHAAVSVAGVAAAVAALAASSVTSPEKPTARHKAPSKTSTAMASAAALVASHCIEIAEEMGVQHDQILAVVGSITNAALRGAATLKARLEKGYGAASISLTDEQVEEANVSVALNFVSKGGELLKRTRKGNFR